MERVYKLLVCPECRSQLHLDSLAEAYCCNKYWYTPLEAKWNGHPECAGIEIKVVEVKCD
ncbi:MAG TPA: hypothetical protein VIY48_04620 [Candidatus Paceibacterota bacterium]